MAILASDNKLMKSGKFYNPSFNPKPAGFNFAISDHDPDVDGIYRKQFIPEFSILKTPYNQFE